MKPSHLLLLLAFNIVWGGIFAIYKQLEPHLEYQQIVTLRFGIAAVGAVALWPLLPGAAPRGWDFVRAVVMGLCVFVVGNRLQVYGNSIGSAGNSAVLMAAEPPMASVAAALFLREHVPARRWLGFALAAFGVLLLNGVWRTDFQWAGLAASVFILLSFLGDTVWSIIGKGVMQRASAFKVVTVALLAGLIVNLLLSGGPTWNAAGALPANAWWLLTFTGLVATLAGYVVWLVVIREADVSLVALTIFVQPIVGIPLAALWVGEPLHWGQLWGALAIVGGLVVGLELRRKQPVAGG